MAHPIVFISHFSVRAGRLEALKLLARDVAASLETGKPQTSVYLIYLDVEGMHATFVHVFGDSAAMDRHFEGAQERSAAAMKFMEPERWEIYGQPSDAALNAIRTAASAAGVAFEWQPEFVAGFSRTS